MTTLKDFSNSSSEYLQKYGNNTIKKQVAAAKYIEQISVQVGIDLSEINILDMFASSNKNLLITSKNVMNKKIFTYAKDNKPKEFMSPELLLARIVYGESAIRQDLDAQFAGKNKYFSRYLTRAKNDLVKADNKNNIRMEKLALIRVRKYERALMANSQLITSDKLIDSLIKVAKDGFWKYLGIEGGHLLWVTVKPIVLTEINSGANLSIKQDMGYFVAKISLNNFYISLHPYRNNIHIDRYYHPYLGPEGDICWGNAYNFARERERKRDIVGLLAVTAAVFSTYSSHNPYKRLPDYIIEGEKVAHNENIKLVDIDLRLIDLLNEKDTAVKVVNEVTNNVCDAHITDSHCEDDDCDSCNDRWPEDEDERWDCDDDY